MKTLHFEKGLLDILKQELENGNIPVIKSNPGNGVQTTIIETMANEGSKAFIVETMNAIGMFQNVQPVWARKGIITDAIEYAEENPDKAVVMVFGDTDRAFLDIRLACIRIATDRTVNEKQLPDNLKILFTSHDDIDMRGVDDKTKTKFVYFNVAMDPDEWEVRAIA